MARVDKTDLILNALAGTIIREAMQIEMLTSRRCVATSKTLQTKFSRQGETGLTVVRWADAS